ncbi:MAG: aspartate/glutamate racemase family protein [Pseudomonadota bacterium]
MKILLANSNTSRAVTAAILAEAQKFASSGTEVTGKNAEFGAEIIGTRAEAAVAAHGLVDMLAKHAAGYDAVVIGMSLDTGIWAAREMLDIPVVAMSEAAMLMAATAASRFGLVIFGNRGAQAYREVVEGYGFDGRLVGIEALGAAPQDMLADPESLYTPIVEGVERLANEQDAEAVVLVGAVMCGLPAILQDRVSVPLLEGISCGILLAESLVRLGLTKPKIGSLQPVPARKVSGLSQHLTGFFERS